MTHLLLQGDARHIPLADESVNCVITSPPYYGLRDYGVEGQLGLEPTPDEYVAHMVEVFREVRRVLKPTGVLFLNLGDSYAGSNCGSNDHREKTGLGAAPTTKYKGQKPGLPDGLKPKDLVGIPWMVARALQAPYYTGQIRAERDRVWLAAMIDAEGSICGFTSVRKDTGDTRTGVHVQITNSNMALLNEAGRIWPASISEHDRPGEGHLGLMDTFRWIAHDVNKKSVLMAEIYPYLVGKRKQALLAWNFFEMSKDAKHLGKSPEAGAIHEKRAWIVAALSELNHLRDVDIPDWCKEPPSLYEPGFYLRSDVIWHKPNPMPESVTDRPTKAHEYVFLLTKSARYFWDAEAVKEPAETGKWPGIGPQHATERDRNEKYEPMDAHPTRNCRSVWSIATSPYKGAHYATMPPKLAERCILAGCPLGGIVFDPFAGSGTTVAVAVKLGRHGVGLDLSGTYLHENAEPRVAATAPMLIPA